MSQRDINMDSISLRSETLGKEKKRKNNFLIPTLIFDLLILGCLLTFAYFLRFSSVFNVFPRFFLCNDPDLQYPYYGGHGKGGPPISTNAIIYVDDIVFYCVVFFLPPAIVLLGEILFACLTPPPPKIITTCCDCFCVPLMVRRLLRFMGIFWLGLLLMSILTDSLKLLSGSQRPYFLNLPSLKVNVTSGTDGPSIYCYADTNSDDDIRDASMSFPSFHSTIASYTATFAICYVQLVFNLHGSTSFRPIINGSLAALAMLAGYSQWMLYRNHWEDILVGYILGFLGGIYMAINVGNKFAEHPTKPIEHQHRHLPLTLSNVGVPMPPSVAPSVYDREEVGTPLEDTKPAIMRMMSTGLPRLNPKPKSRVY